MHSYMIDKVLYQKDSSRDHYKGMLPVDRRLVFYSGAFILLMSVFYTVLYFGIDITSEHLDISIIKVALSAGSIRLIAVFTILIGAVLTVQAREKLEMLTSREIVFSLNKSKNQQASSGVYGSMRHPMYVGIVLVTVSSFLLFPSLLGLLLLICIYICLLMKITIEK